MIICVSANPAIDRRLRVDRLVAGEVNRARVAEPAPGGKAAHVAMASRALGEEVLWVGFLGGATGDECERGLAALRVRIAAVRTTEPTRVNLEIIDGTGRVTEVLEPGGAVSAEEVREMFYVCETLFEEWGTEAQVALSGSLPPGAPDDFYAKLTRAAKIRGCGVLLDTSGAALLRSIEASPDLVKPNRDEAQSVTGLSVRDEHLAADAARWMIARGARAAAISLEGAGLVWIGAADEEPIIARPPVVDVRSTVGCGDATVAGFAVARARGLCAEETLRLAVACGAANCLAAAPGMINPQDVNRIAPHVKLCVIGADQD
jgi:1-phosphofructokinase family hexose kinase